MQFVMTAEWNKDGVFLLMDGKRVGFIPKGVEKGILNMDVDQGDLGDEICKFEVWPDFKDKSLRIRQWNNFDNIYEMDVNMEHEKKEE